MTFRLRRKRQITQPSTCLWTGVSGEGPSRVGRKRLVAALGLSLLAGSTLIDSFGTTAVNAAEPGGVRSYLSKTLQKFKHRSPEERYQQYKAEQAELSPSESLFAEPRRLPEGDRSRAAADLLPEQPSVFVLVSKDANEVPLPAPAAANETDEPGFITELPNASPSGTDLVESAYQKVETDPRNLKSIRDIQPFHDYQPGSHIEPDLDPEFVAPAEVELGEVSDGARGFEAILYQWQASNLHHYPLYFQDPGLERYGHVHHELIQPFVSVGKFGLQLVGLPYQMTIDPVCQKQYAVGWYRPGECAPKQTQQIPWNSTAALNQAVVVTGLSFAIP
jgi:hypothetical protein